MSEAPIGFHLECPSGLAGDMFLGACLDLGMPLEALSQAVDSLALPGVSLDVRRASRGGVAGTRFRVLVDGAPLEGADPEEMDAKSLEAFPEGPEAQAQPGSTEGHHHHSEHQHDHGHQAHEHSGKRGHDPRPRDSRDYRSIRRLIVGSSLEPAVRERALELFARLAEVEGAIHGMGVDDVHFHEVGAIDSIVDLVGACAAVEALEMTHLTCGTVVVGSGMAQTDHGLMPVPAPATAELIRGVPTVGGGQGELLTPTGALLLSSLCRGHGPQPAMAVDAIGYGLGRWQLADRPNACRLVRGVFASAGLSASASVTDPTAGDAGDAGDARDAREARDARDIVQIETQVDDRSAEGLGYAMEQLLAAGCLDVFFTAVQMKKNRPGTLVTVLCRRGAESRLARVLLEHTGSLGCRFRRLERLEAERRIETVDTEFGPVRVKLGFLDSQRYVTSPEFDDCRRLAFEHKVPVRAIEIAARAAAARTPA